MWRVLIAEDDPKTRETLVKGFKKTARCVSVANGDEALKTYQAARNSKTPFDFILLDVTMPGTDGFEVLKTIRDQEEKNPHPLQKESRIIMITAYKDSLLENYNMGWDDFITKPVDIKILTERMRALTK